MVKTATGGYAVGFLLMGLVALGCLLVLAGLARAGVRDPAAHRARPA